MLSNIEHILTLHILDAATGAAGDWALAETGIKYVYGLEGRGPYIPSNDEIQPSFDEIMAGIFAMVKEIEVIED